LVDALQTVSLLLRMLQLSDHSFSSRNAVSGVKIVRESAEFLIIAVDRCKTLIDALKKDQRRIRRDGGLSQTGVF
jgi:hypothetical protein